MAGVGAGAGGSVVPLVMDSKPDGVDLCFSIFFFFNACLEITTAMFSMHNCVAKKCFAQNISSANRQTTTCTEGKSR